MNVTVEDINDTRKRLSVAVEAEKIQEEHDSLVKEFARKARIPGFRPGKAPKPMIEKRFSREINDELKKKVVSSSYRQALEESKLDPLSVLEVDGADEIQIGQENRISFVLDIRPAFNLPEYKGIEIEEPPEAVTDEEVDQFIDRIRSQRADFNQVEREAGKGDYVKLSYEGKIDGKPIAEIVPDAPIFGTQSATWEEVDGEESPIPGFAAALSGLKPGDKKEIPVSFPEDHAQEALQGKEATYAIEILEVRERVMPELTDEFAKSLRVESVEELRDHVRKDLEQRKKAEARSQKRRQLTERLGSMVEFSLPETALEKETNSVLREFLEANLQRGVPQEQFEEKKEELVEGARKAAAERVKIQFLLARIAEAEKIEVTDEDLSRYIYFQAQQRQEKPDKIVKELRKEPERVDSIRQSLLFDKTLDFLLENAKLTKAES